MAALALLAGLRDAERRLLSSLARNRGKYQHDSDDTEKRGVPCGVGRAVLFHRQGKRPDRHHGKEDPADLHQAHGGIIGLPGPA
jgi:hypothetical protein